MVQRWRFWQAKLEGEIALPELIVGFICGNFVESHKEPAQINPVTHNLRRSQSRHYQPVKGTAAYAATDQRRHPPYLAAERRD